MIAAWLLACAGTTASPPSTSPALAEDDLVQQVLFERFYHERYPGDVWDSDMDACTFIRASVAGNDALVLVESGIKVAPPRTVYLVARFRRDADGLWSCVPGAGRVLSWKTDEPDEPMIETPPAKQDVCALLKLFCARTMPHERSDAGPGRPNDDA